MKMKEMVRLKQRSLISRTADYLSDFVLNADLKHGDYLPPEHELCHQLGIGRSTLRESIAVLESKGLLKRRQGKGVQVVDKSREAASGMLRLLFAREQASVQDLLEARHLIETKAAYLAAQRAKPDDLMHFQKILEDMRNENLTLEEYRQIDLEFHLAIVSATQNSVLTLLIQAIRPLLQESLNAVMKASHDFGKLIMLRHKEIYEAIEKREPQKATLAMEKHLRRTERNLSRILKQET
jgi:DNA-binding FadR family transcriptional regulator